MITSQSPVDQSRRLFVSSAAAILAAAPFGLVPPAEAQPATAAVPVIRPGANTSLGPLKHIDAGVLRWRLRATASSFPICVAMAPRAFCPARHSATASPQRWRSMLSTS
jgi:hypothetical protein